MVILDGHLFGKPFLGFSPGKDVAFLELQDACVRMIEFLDLFFRFAEGAPPVRTRFADTVCPRNHSDLDQVARRFILAEPVGDLLEVTDELRRIAFSLESEGAKKMMRSEFKHRTVEPEARSNIS